MKGIDQGTCVPPQLGQVTLALPWLSADLQDVPTQRLRGNGNLGDMMLAAAQVHRQEHLQVAIVMTPKQQPS